MSDLCIMELFRHVPQARLFPPAAFACSLTFAGRRMLLHPASRRRPWGGDDSLPIAAVRISVIQDVVLRSSLPSDLCLLSLRHVLDARFNSFQLAGYREK